MKLIPLRPADTGQQSSFDVFKAALEAGSPERGNGYVEFRRRVRVFDALEQAGAAEHVELEDADAAALEGAMKELRFLNLPMPAQRRFLQALDDVVNAKSPPKKQKAT